MNNKLNSNHLPWLDALRFIAAFMVLLSHSRNDFFLPYGELPDALVGGDNFVFYTFCRLGHEAVMIFFVISGFLVCGRGLERIHNNNFDVKNYGVDRTVRIGLPLIGAIIFYFVVCQIIGREFSWLTALGNLFSLQGLFVDNLVSPFWSLSFEVWFYVLLAGVALVFQKKKVGWFVCVLICLVFCKMKASYLLMWFLGGLAYIHRPKKSNKWLAWLYFLLMIAGMFFLQLTTESRAMKDMVVSLNRPMLEMIFAMFVALFVQQIILFQPKRKVWVKIEHFMSKMAVFSYTLYLSHRIVFLLLFYFFFKKGTYLPDWEGKWMYVLFLVLVLACCYGIYFISERHTSSVKMYLKKKLHLVK